MEMEEYQGISTNKTLHFGERQQQQHTTTTTSRIEASVCDFVVAKFAYYSRVYNGRRQHDRIERSPIAHVHQFVLSRHSTRSAFTLTHSLIVAERQQRVVYSCARRTPKYTTEMSDTRTMK